MDIKLALKEYGLSEKEIEVFLALLPMGPISLQDVARKVNYPRATAYDVLNYLANKGLIYKVNKKSATYYSATEPEKLQDRLKEKMRLIEQVLPELKDMKSSTDNPSRVETYEGLGGIYAILSDVYKINQQLYYFGNYKNSLDVLKHLPQQARLMRLERNIPAKVILDYSDEDIIYTQKYRELTELRLLNTLKDFPMMIFIYGEKVAMYTIKGDVIGIIISNKEFAKAMKIMFDVYWSMAKPSISISA